VLLFITSLYSLASVPLALHYLSKERFALWALMAGIGGYLSLIDLGMSNSVARLLIDHKDLREGGTYGSLIKTGWLVLVVQAGIVFLAGFGLAPAICELLAIQPDLQREFIQLLRWQSIGWALSFGLRIFSQVLLAHQRIDIYNYSQVAALGLSFGLLWFFFHAGQGVFSLVWAGLPAAFFGPAILFLACWQLKLFPPAGAWGHASWRDFKEIFLYGKDLFLVGVGNQLIMASQTMIITRQLGLEAAAAWSIGTRTFSLVSQAVWRVFDVSGPALSEMIARGEHSTLRERYRAIVVPTVSLSALAAVVYAMCNSLFVTVWTHHKIAWPPLNDVLLAAWMIVLGLVHCHNGFVLVTKKIDFMRYAYFVEGMVFVIAAFLTVRWGGLPAMIICSVACSILFSGAYGVWRVSRYFDLPLREVAWRWSAPAMKVLVSFAPVALAGWWALKCLDSPILRLALNASLGGSLGFYLFLRYGLPHGLKRELIARAPGNINPILRRVLVRAAR
jgi:O-antigen/teichoic acid export membrane protein